MALNEQLDENAADLRNIEAQPPVASVPSAPVQDTNRNVSRTEIAVAIGIMIGLVVIVYFFLARQPAPSAPIPVQQPLRNSSLAPTPQR